MTDIVIEQAIFVRAAETRLVVRSAGFLDEWVPLAEELCAGFGVRPAGVRCPACVFAKPFRARHVAVVQVADAVGRPDTLGFRLLIARRDAFVKWIGDPFVFADRFPPDWQARGELPALSWPAVPPALRTVAQIQTVLQRSDGPTLLGGVQALVDGSRLVFERPQPDTDLLRSLWLLLPSSNRCDMWPASFAFSNALQFDAVIVPQMDTDTNAGYLSGRDAENYPEGGYELNLQIAAEAGNQRELDALFARRSRKQTLRLGLVLLVVITIMMIVMNLLSPQRQNEQEKPAAPRDKASAP
jgi:hypothetical protein